MKFTRDDTKIIKAYAIFLMLYHHLFTFHNRSIYKYVPLFSFSDKSTAYLLGVFGKLCVAIFIFIGGYGTYKSYNNENNLFLKDKIFSLYKNYWKVFIFVILLFLLFKVDLINVKTLLLNFIGVESTYCCEWWFFTLYILLTLIAPLLIKLLDKYTDLKKDKKIDLFISLCFVIILNSVMVIAYSKIYKYFFFINPKYLIIRDNYLPFLLYFPIYFLGFIFARYDILDFIKEKTYNKPVFCLFSFAAIGLIFYLRLLTRYIFDFIYVVIFVIAILIIHNNIGSKKFNNFLIAIGKQSTNIWLLHTVYCYTLFGRIVYAPKYTILIFIWLLFLTYCSGIIIDKIMDKIVNFKDKNWQFIDKKR